MWSEQAGWDRAPWWGGEPKSDGEAFVGQSNGWGWGEPSWDGAPKSDREAFVGGIEHHETETPYGKQSPGCGREALWVGLG
jgi:hypothetical protein